MVRRKDRPCGVWREHTKEGYREVIDSWGLRDECKFSRGAKWQGSLAGR